MTAPWSTGLRDAVLAYAERGIPVLPLHGKLPRIPAAHSPGDRLYQHCRSECGKLGHGVHDATTDPDQVRELWQRWPHANVGLRTGVGFDVIDVDGTRGRHSLQRFLAEHAGGVPIGGPRVRTGSGAGWHLYVAPTGLPDTIGVLDSVDYRAAGRYVVAPPSRHPTTGRRYQWVPGRDLDTPLAALQAECAELAATPEGERNRQLWESARNLYNLVAGGLLSEVQVDQAIRHAAAQCGLLEQEPRQTEATLASARQVGLAHPRGIPDQPGRQHDASPHPPVRPPPKHIAER